jgi:adenylate cyclase
MTEEIKGGVTLFADLAGSTSLYESLGDVAASLAVRAQLEQISSRIRENDGRVIKTIGDAVHAWLPGADSAANAAIAIQRTCHGTLPVRVGFHYGAAIHEHADIFGDAVNVAARLASMARAGEILTSSETMQRLSAARRALAREAGAGLFKGKARSMHMYQLLWEEDETAVTSAFHPGGPGDPQLTVLADLCTLRLRFGRRKPTVTRHVVPYTFGRDKGVSLRVDSSRVSRNHAHLEFRHGKYVLVDHSTNGTFVTPQGGTEVHLQRESMPLLGLGTLALGGSALTHPDLVIGYEQLS